MSIPQICMSPARSKAAEAHVRTRRHAFALGLCVTLLFFTATSVALGQLEFEGPPIRYHDSDVNDPIAQLVKRIETGDIQFEWDDQHGWLPSLLKAIEVPESSQTLVFSKTSLQIQRISPSRPRALYFNDDIYVGWVQHGDVIELGSVDPQQGAIFYTLSQRHTEQPQIKRDRGDCLSCHASYRTKGVPGFLLRSVYAGSDGRPHFGLGTKTTDPTSPFEERYGGWYVTGRHGEMRHRGNVIAENNDEAPIDPELGANLTQLPDRVDSSAYLQPHSDLVALMVFEHQSQMHNLITRASYETRRAAHYDGVMNKALERPATYKSDSRKRRIRSAGDKLLEAILFCGEYRLTSPVSGTSNFQKEFPAAGPQDSKGRSLRDFDLKARIFRYPCSFLIYSDSYRGLPDEMRDYVETRLAAILSGTDTDPQFEHLDVATRTAILEILNETLPGFSKRVANSRTE